MEFGDKIKALRKENDLTQDAFAKKLNVTRQAVSNWENNKNLPDIEIIIKMATEFHVSLDYLILEGDKEMKQQEKIETVNPMTAKLVKDGSEGRRARMNMISTIIGAFLMLMGLMCLFIKANSVEYIDSQGILHENFYLLPIGFMLMFAGLVVIVSTAIIFTVKRIRSKR